MSRIGKLPIRIPEKVKVHVADGVVRVEGPKGTLEHRLPPGLRLEVSGDSLHVSRESESRTVRGLHGLTQRLLANMVEGVHAGFSRTLEIVGVGYRAEGRGQAIHLSLGFSHPILFQLPPGVQARVDKQTVVTLESIDKQLLGETVANIRRLRPPEPYKGKGIKYAGEVLRRKAGKAAGAAGAG
ncbi:MAG: ribosomal protein [Deltaproteobacteria bacterium]|jgi:large subunit ribosomal protein L6|nr:ribosomal protein [Deltaproteobacteria bacterium]